MVKHGVAPTRPRRGEAPTAADVAAWKRELAAPRVQRFGAIRSPEGRQYVEETVELTDEQLDQLALEAATEELADRRRRCRMIDRHEARMRRYKGRVLVMRKGLAGGRIPRACLARREGRPRPRRHGCRARARSPGRRSADDPHHHRRDDVVRRRALRGAA